MAKSTKSDVEASEATGEQPEAKEVPLTPAEALVEVLEHAYRHASGVTPWMIETAREIASGTAP